MNEKEIKELKHKAEWKGDVDAAKKLAYMYRQGTDGVEPSATESIKWYKKAASKGDADSMGWIGWFYLGNKGCEKDESNAYKWLKKACEAGDASSMKLLSNCYRKGTGVKQDLKKSVQWLEKGVEGNSSNCMYELALMYMDGRDGVEKNEYKAAYYMGLSAQNNVKMGMYYYGKFYNEGIGVEVDNWKALEWWKKSAEAGCLEAKFSLGSSYLKWNFSPDPEIYYSDGVCWLEAADREGHKEAAYELGQFYKNKKKDTEKANKWYKKSANTGNALAMRALSWILFRAGDNAEGLKWLKNSADAGDRGSMVMLGNEYLKGVIIAPDYDKAKYYLEKGYDPEDMISIKRLAELYVHTYYERGKTVESYRKALYYSEKAAQMGDVEMMVKLGNLYMVDDMISEENIQHAIHWFKEAAQKDCAEAMYNLANIYLEQKSDAKLLKFGREWMDKAAENNFEKAVSFVSDMYFNGKYGAVKDYAKSAYWLKIASQKYNDAGAYTNLGISYVKGLGVDEDPALGAKCLKKAAELGDEKAYYNLGVVYKKGIGVEIDYDEAIRWFEKANEGQVPDKKALYGLGVTYIDKGDRKKAIEYLEKAVEHGHKDAQKELDELRELMANEKSAMDELESYIGLNKVKQKMREFEATIKMKERRRQFGQQIENSGFMHMLFIGGPGTGKTEVAKLVTRILYEMGVISKPEPVIAERGDLVAKYVGQTESKTNEVIEKALGGVLFIDEAYTLAKKGSDSDFGQEAIDALLTAMVKYRDNLVVIAAGYTSDMERFLDANQGLKSRFGTIIEFEDYTADELYAIFERLCKNSGLTIEKDAIDPVKDYLEKRVGLDDFGNARGVGKYFSEIIERQNDRLVKMLESGMGEEEIKKEVLILKVEDVVEEKEKKPNEMSPMEELESYIGLHKVKQKMRELEINLKMKRRREALGQNVGGNGFMHMIFSGNPGTGKTEVAKIVARVLCEIGVISNPKPIIVERADLVGDVIGETEKKTDEVIKKAIGGVLFIDEAYTLVKDNGRGSDFGQIAIDAILTAMVKYKDNLVVIAAGYTEAMERFLESNKGLRSRFGEIIEFEDYTADELYAIFNNLLKKKGFIMSENAENLVYEYLSTKAGDEDFANGRGVGSFVDRMVSSQNNRIISLEKSGLEDEEINKMCRIFTEEDVIAAYK